MLWIGLAIGIAVGVWFWWACTVPTSTFFRPVLIRGPREGHRISLTFDDGPAPPYTEKILDILREYKVPATFFVCGKNAERYPHLLLRMVAEGHAIGNHTYSHLYVYFKSRKRLAEEIDHTQDVIEKVTGTRPQLFRPPYGARWFGLIPILKKRHMRLVQWSAAGYDWQKGAPGIVQSTLRGLVPGAVILLHDGRDTRPVGQIDRSATAEALPLIIDEARQRGYEFAPLLDFLPSA